MKGEKREPGKGILPWLLTIAMVVTLIPTSFAVQTSEVSAATTVRAPRVTSENTTWDCVYFGSYPQTEIVDKASTSGCYGKAWEESGDYVVDASLYSQLENASYDSNGDATVAGKKYRKISKSDATYSTSTSGSSSYYNWASSPPYRYFRYDKIKWRVLETGGGYAMLLADKALDDQSYNTSYTNITWENSTIRSWLNGYGSSYNTYGTDYSSKNFIDTAFSSSEQSAIKSAGLSNDNNIFPGIEGGNDTTDKVFLLSESDVWNTDKAVSHGFVKDYDTNAKQRRAKSTSYAKAMGLYSNTSSDYLGNCRWWLRSTGSYSTRAAYINFNGLGIFYGKSVFEDDYAVRPALYLNLSSSIWTNAGTVSSDGTTDEVELEKPTTFDVNLKCADIKNPITAKYSEDYFKNSSYSYNHELARLTLCTELSAFTADTSGWGESDSDSSALAKSRYANIKDAYDQMGFTDNVKYYNYGKSLNDTSDKVAFSIAKNPRTNVIAVIIRGGGYGGEWASNFNVGSGGDNAHHNGWEKAADEIYDKVVQYVGNQEGSVKLWISGYSRGAAVANLFTQRINQYADGSSKLKRENIYAYTFATPQGANNGNATIEKNLFNIVNPGDPVPCVAPTAWGYSRLGTTKYFYQSPSVLVTEQIESNYKKTTGESISIRTNLKQKDSVAALMKVLKDVYPTVAKSKKIQLVIADFMAFQNTKVQKGGEWKQCTVDEYYQKLIDKYGTESVLESYQYADTYLNSTESGKNITKIVNGSKYGALKEYIPLLFTLVYIHDSNESELAKVIEKAARGKNVIEILDAWLMCDMFDGSGIAKGHYPQVYLAWMQLDEKDAFSRKYKIFDYIQIMCPVDVLVYDNNDNLVAEIRNHNVVNASIPVLVGAEETDLFLSPDELESYRIEIIPNDDGKMNYFVSSLDNEYNVVHKTTYENINITKGKALNSYVVETPNYEQGQYNLTDGENEIKPSSEYYDSQITLESVDVVLPKSEYTYSGKTITPGVAASKGGVELIEGKDYTVTYSTGRKNVGTYKVTLNGKEKYTGTVTKTFKINPKSTSIYTLSKARKAFTVKWKKQSTKMSTSRITGYQIRYGTKSSMAGAKTVTVKGYSTVSKKISRLKARKKYYVQVRTYKTISGKKYYSAWSARKSVTTK